MEERSKPVVRHGSLSNLGRRVSRAGIAAGFLLLAMSLPLPERLQLAFACSGITLALLSAAVLVSLTAHPTLRWKGVSPALGIVLGVMVGAVPGLLSGTWLRTENRPPARPASLRTTASPRNEMGAAVTMPVAPPESVAPAPAPAPAPVGAPLGPVLTELSYILDRKARPALDSLYRLLTSVADAPESTDPVSLRSQLEPSVNELAEAAASLERIQSENSDLSPQLREAIGSGRALSSLNSSLHQLTLAQGDARAYGSPRLRRLANATESASRWVDGVDQQLAGAQAATPDASR